MTLKKTQKVYNILYNIADFLVIQLSLSRFSLKSPRSSHVCLNLNYISAAQFYQSDNQNINIISNQCGPANFFFWLTFDCTLSASRDFFGRFSADKFSG